MKTEVFKLDSIKARSKKRLGRGYGSGKGGHTASRGQKGQKSRGKMPLLFEGTKQRKSLFRRTPLLRGKLRNKSYQCRPIIVNLKYLNIFDDGQEVSIESLVAKKIIDLAEAKAYGVKILGDGEVGKKLTVKIKTSKTAGEKILKAGGKLENSSK